MEKLLLKTPSLTWPSSRVGLKPCTVRRFAQSGEAVAGCKAAPEASTVKFAGRKRSLLMGEVARKVLGQGWHAACPRSIAT